MDALAVLVVLGIAAFGTQWLDYLCNFVLLPLLGAIIVYNVCDWLRGKIA